MCVQLRVFTCEVHFVGVKTTFHWFPTVCAHIHLKLNWTHLVFIEVVLRVCVCVCVKWRLSDKDYYKTVHKSSLNSTPRRLAVLWLSSLLQLSFTLSVHCLSILLSLRLPASLLTVCPPSSCLLHNRAFNLRRTLCYVSNAPGLLGDLSRFWVWCVYKLKKKRLNTATTRQNACSSARHAAARAQ